MNSATAAAFDALGDATRRAMIARIAQGPVTVSALAQPLGITLTAVGQHVHVLEAAGLTASEKHGRVRYCRLRADGIRAIEDWARHCRIEWEARLDRLGSVLDDLDE